MNFATLDGTTQIYSRLGGICCITNNNLISWEPDEKLKLYALFRGLHHSMNVTM